MLLAHADPATVKHKLRTHYDGDAAQYHVAHYVAPGPYSPLQQRQFYIEEMIRRHASPGARILDVGCGPGELVLSLLDQGYDARGVDISDGMVREARELLNNRGYASQPRVAVGDIEKIGFDDDSFEVVVASGVLEYQRKDDTALREIYRVLRPGGLVAINITNRYAYIIWLDAMYRWLKTRPASRRVLDVIKRKLGGGPLNNFPDHRTHAPAAFDMTLARHGFRKITHNYFHFSPLPMPLDNVVPGIARPIGRAMERLTR